MSRESGHPTDTANSVEELTRNLRATEQRLRETEEHLRTLFEHAPESVSILDINTGRLVDANVNAERLFGMSREELRETGPLERSPEIQPNGRRSVDYGREMIEAAQAGGTPCFEWTHLNKDDEPVECEVRLSRLPWPGRNLIRGSVTVITDRKRAERALQASEELNRQILDAVPGGIVLISKDGTILKFNEETARLAGLPAEDLLGHSLREWGEKTLHEDGSRFDADEYPALKCVATGEPQGPTTIGTRRPDGSILWGIYTALPVRDPASGELTGAVVTFLDVTHRKQIEDELKQLNETLEQRVAERTAEWQSANESLRQFEEKWRSLTEHAPDFIINLDREGTILLINRTAPGFTVEETIGMSCYDYLLPEHHELMRDVLEKVFTTGQPQQYEILGVGAYQQPAWYINRLAPIYRRDEVVAATLIATDITEWKRAEERLKVEQRLLRKLLDLHEHERKLVAYEIHDGFLQDIVGAKMSLEALRDELEIPDGPHAEDLNRIERLLTSAIGEGRRLIDELRPMIVDEAGVVAAVDYLIGEEQRKGGLQIGFDHDVRFDRLPTLLEGTVFRIVQEALANVRRHSHSENANVHLHQDNGTLRLEIADDGIGFDPAAVPEDHFGVRSIQERARLFGGTARIESEPGGGTRVLVELPINLPSSPTE